MTDFLPLIRSWPLQRLIRAYPLVDDFLLNLNLPALDGRKTLAAALLAVSGEQLAEFGLRAADLPEQLALFLETMTRETEAARAVERLSVLAGRDKSGNPEAAGVEIRAGEVVSIVGPTGSGKSRLLADIECLAQRDTPTGRQILINGAAVEDDDRFRLEGKIVAQLSQNMNFVMDLTVAEFLEMHARCRGEDAAAVRKCFECANTLAGEKFTAETKVTQLSGGQSRALMIADTAYMSKSPIVLIDEIENAGVDRREAIALLTRQEKIVLISTHDPLLALGADKRIVIRNGGIASVLTTTAEEKESLVTIEKIDRMMQIARDTLRGGGRVAIDRRAGAKVDNFLPP
ncbi:MAG: ABC transporter ATP-binding protein [Gracilibacteraceae bacterium]|jgi:ABC-type lipoprotein export system ATPase subunit|nr:ABC transporter ATP-binding protein [Gracilibacteraceae bacterium]